MNTKYIFVTGGVVSGLGKGITAASIGRLLKNRGYKVTIQKFDPYINVDPGTMNPYEHGEVFVTEDGAETDLDLGHYERFIDENLTKNSSITMGKIYQSVIEKERRGDYLGKTVQVIPHITNEIKKRIYSFENTDTDIVITEVGGTVGDIEGLSIIEAIRQVGLEKNPNDVVYIHVTLLPYIFGPNEIKSKPTQHSVKELQSLGIKPNILVCRTESEIPEEIKEKLSLFCNVRKTSVILNKTSDCLYAVPIMLEKEGLGREICNHLRLDSYVPDNYKWEKMILKIRKINKENPLNIAIVGNYIKLEDSYLSIMESIKHAGYFNNANVKIKLIDSEKITSCNVGEILKGIHGVIVPGEFEEKGIEGKIETIRYIREKNISFLGIGFGMQLAIIEFIKNVVKNTDMEFNKNYKNILINNINEVIHKNVRIGAYSCVLKEDSLINKLYGQNEIMERHKHYFEYCNFYNNEFEKNGLKICGMSPDGNLIEMIELKNHPYFIVSQFNPEYKSRPNKPAPLFVGLIDAAKKYRYENKNLKVK